MSLVFTIEINNGTLADQTIAQIFEFRNNKTLRIKVLVGEQTQGMDYDTFSKLANVRKMIQDLEYESPKFKPSTSTTTNTTTSAKPTAMDDITMIKTASTLIKEYSGSPDNFAGFKSNVELMQSMTPAALMPKLCKFIRGRLTGTASSYIGNSVSSVSEIIDILNEKIKMESSEIAMARLAAIRYDPRSLTKFSDEMEEAAGKLSIAYINEGIPSEVANKMSVKNVADVCRNAISDPVVKAVIASTSFATPKEVISKFQVEATKASDDKRMLAIRQGSSTQRYNNQERRQYQNYNNYNNNYNNNYRNNRGGNQSYRGNRGNFNGRGGPVNNGHSFVRILSENEQDQSRRSGQALPDTEEQ